jgi:hypothetical protein
MTSHRVSVSDPVEHFGVRFAGLIASLNSSKYPTNGSRKIEVELAALDVPHAEAEVLQPG